MPVTEWVQLDTIRTRERHAVEASNSGQESHDHAENFTAPHNGTIGGSEYESAVFDPALDRSQGPDGASPDVDQRVSAVRSAKWLTTPRVGTFGFNRWTALLSVSGSAVGLVDFEPSAWRTEAEAAAIAAFDADPPPGVTFRVLEWETNPFQVSPWGTYTNRMVEFDVSVLENEQRDRDGDLLTPPSTVLEHGALMIPDQGEDDAIYAFDDDLGMWRSASHLAARSYSIAESADLFDPPLTLAINGGAQVDISDATWAAHARTVRLGTSSGLHNLSVPLLLAPTFALTGDTDVLPDEEDVTYTATAAVYLESDWTPPRYRFVYTTEEEAPRSGIRIVSRDHDGAFSGGRRVLPRPRSNRVVGNQP